MSYSKNLFALLLFSFIIINTYAQQAYRKPASQESIPPSVLKAFKEQYPKVLLQGWYTTHITYWQQDVSAGWYSGWYGPQYTTTVVVYTYSKPNYYEVEFLDQPGEFSRAIYNIYGYWFETRTQIKGLPLGIKEALDKSEYAEWKRSPFKEKIETPAWPVAVYRFKVSKGLRSRIIRMDAEGNIIQEKYLPEN